jgi:hypothetical protein
VSADVAPAGRRHGSVGHQIGDVKADDGTMTADIVTIDNSLVQRLKVN